MGNSEATSFSGISTTLILIIGIFATVMTFISVFGLMLQLERIKAEKTEPSLMTSIRIQGKQLIQRLRDGMIRVFNTFTRYIPKLYKSFQTTLLNLVLNIQAKRITSNKSQSSTSSERGSGTKETPPLLPSISETLCPNCGEVIRARANYCSNCSFPLLPIAVGASNSINQQSTSLKLSNGSVIESSSSSQRLAEIDAINMPADLLVQVKLHLLWDRAEN